MRAGAWFGLRVLYVEIVGGALFKVSIANPAAAWLRTAALSSSPPRLPHPLPSLPLSTSARPLPVWATPCSAAVAAALPKHD